jgi:hypothetical protein
MDSDTLTKQIQSLVRVNNEIIDRITTLRNSDNELVSYEYVMTPADSKDNEPYQFKIEVLHCPPCTDLVVQEVAQKKLAKQVIDDWRVPADATLPEEVDPEKMMYGDFVGMDITCQTFADLVRINQQEKVALR